MTESINVRFCRLYLKEVEKDVLKHFDKSVLKAAKVGKLSSIGCNQYWEFWVPAVDGLAKERRIELKASCAYEARAKAWTQILEEYGYTDKEQGAAIK